MDWNGVIEKNREALKRILASLIAIAEAGCRGQFTFFPQGGALPQDVALAEKSKLSPAPTLPRHLHRAVLRLLRPAEAAARRLIIVAARGLIVELPPARPRKPKPDPKAAHAALRSLGIAVVMPHHAPHPAARGKAGPGRTPVRARIALPLFDPIHVPRPGRPRYVPAHAAPRILSFDGAAPRRLPPPPSADDPIDATRLKLRLGALASALDDLPKHARRFARWKMRRDAVTQTKDNRDRVRRFSPLRPGRPPGLNAANRRRPSHQIHNVLADLQYFAIQALKQPDTS